MREISELLSDYSAGTAQLKEVLNRTPADAWDSIPIPGQWSIRQVLCHLADAEIIYADRMKRVLAEDNPTFFNADPDQFEAALYSQERDPTEEVSLIAAVRAHMFRTLSACDIEAYQRTGVHSTDGPMTLETLLERITQHIPHHIEFIKAKLAALSGQTSRGH